jgi:hypothetical protein
MPGSYNLFQIIKEDPFPSYFLTPAGLATKTRQGNHIKKENTDHNPS